jgi:hypothetical protein
VAQIVFPRPAIRFVEKLSHIRRHYSVCYTIATALAFVLCIGSVSAQSTTSNTRELPKKEKAPVVSNPIPAAPVAVPPVALPVEPREKPLKQPVISWDGKLLTIDAENSALSDILLGIRARTGASVEMPPNTASEHVAVHLGPAPIRDVISSLLYGTDYDYIVQASDSDPDGLRAVILTLREKDGNDVKVAGDPNNHMRLMPGYSAPGKRDFQVAHEAEEAAAGSSADSANTNDNSTAAAAPVAADAATAQNSSASETQPNTPSSTAPADSASADPGLTIGVERQPNQSALLSSGQVGSPDASSMSQMQQNLQRMYDQRKQIQAQQNQGIPPHTP